MTTTSEENEEMSADSEEISADSIDGTFVPRQRPNVAGVELDGEMVLLVEGTAKTHWLSQSAAIVWDCLDGEISLDDLSAEIAQAFGADPTTVREDVISGVGDMGRAGLLDGVAEELPQMVPYEPPEGLPLGEDLSSINVSGLDGNTVGFEGFRGRKVLLINWSPYCGYCRQITSDLAELQPGLRAQGVELVLVALGNAEDNQSAMAEGGLDCTLLLQDGTLEVFAGIGTPSAYLIDEEGKVASKLAVGAFDVPSLARTAAGQDEPQA